MRIKTAVLGWIPVLALPAMVLAGCGTPTAQGGAGKSSNTPRVASAGHPAGVTIKGGMKVIGFYDQSTSNSNSFQMLKSHPGLVSYLAPFWYEVTPSGGLLSKSQGNAAQLAGQDHIPITPLINNQNGNATFLHTAAGRAAAVKAIVGMVNQGHYPGVHIDFQLLKPSDKTDLTLFMQTLAKALPSGSYLTMSIIPPTSSNMNGQAGAYDLAKLQAITKGLVVMAYDLHGDGTPPGPVSPFPWVKTAIADTEKAGVPTHKIILGIANYGYLWKAGSTSAATIPLYAMHQHRYGNYTYNTTEQEGTTKTTISGTSGTVWFVPDRGAVARIQLAEQDHLGGVAFWRLGYEDMKWWNAVSSALTGKP